MKLLERYNTDLNSPREEIRFSESVCTFAVTVHTFKPEFIGMLPAAILAVQPVGDTRNQQHF